LALNNNHPVIQYLSFNEADHKINKSIKKGKNFVIYFFIYHNSQTLAITWPMAIYVIDDKQTISTMSSTHHEQGITLTNCNGDK
jgi:hypothetical protein